jgi:hypothetical protein
MPTGTFEYHSDAERLAIEAAIAFVADLHRLALTAPDGQVLACCEQRALAQGRDLLRSALQRAVQARIDRAEAKGGPPAAARVPARSASSGAVSGTC